MKVYLSGAIELVPYEVASQWRRRAKELAQEFTDIIVVDPLDYEDPDAPMYDEQIVNTNRHLLTSCDVVLVDGRQPSWGTAMEVALAHREAVPVVVWGIGREQAPTFLRHHATLFEEALPNAVLRTAELSLPTA